MYKMIEGSLQIQKNRELALFFKEKKRNIGDRIDAKVNFTLGHTSIALVDR